LIGVYGYLESGGVFSKAWRFSGIRYLVFCLFVVSGLSISVGNLLVVLYDWNRSRELDVPAGHPVWVEIFKLMVHGLEQLERKHRQNIEFSRLIV
jgi:hypothetical protein